MSRLQCLRGMVDLLPEQTRCWQAVESVIREHCSRSAIHEIRTPILELTELFARGIGEETDVVGKEMYTFLDRSDRSCTLRPEGTASVVRAAVQHGLVTQGLQRLWYMGPMFRYERPQAGRQRQFHQLGVEFLGFASARSDIELISFAWDLLVDLGISSLQLQINSLGTAEDRAAYRNALVSWLEQREQHLDIDSQHRLRSNPLRILDSKDLSTQRLLLEAPSLLDSLSPASANRLDQIVDMLAALDIPFVVNHRLVRGLDYYDHTAFEIVSDQLGAQSTVCGGGRYNGLIEQLGGPSMPAIGLAFGMERLMLLLAAAARVDPAGRAATICAQLAPSLYIVNRGDDAATQALILARRLRSAGVVVELDDSGSAFGKQFKRADRSGAQFALVIGPDEAQRDVVVVKNLRQNLSLDFGDAFELSQASVLEILPHLELVADE
jgi:histidyl-tRNA synthetase